MSWFKDLIAETGGFTTKSHGLKSDETAVPVTPRSGPSIKIRNGYAGDDYGEWSFETDVIPRIGESIFLHRPEWTSFVVEDVRHSFNDEDGRHWITIEVRPSDLAARQFMAERKSK